MTLPVRRKLNIGITIGLSSAGESLWINGIKQNALFLAKLFQHSELGHSVTLLNTTDVELTDRLPWDRTQFPTASLKDWTGDLDVLIELGGQISADETRRLKSRGTKIVSYVCGPEYVINMEAIIFRPKLWDSIFINQNYDDIWVIPQVAVTSLHFFQSFRRRPAKVVPFVWDPLALEAATKELPNRGEYRLQSGPKRLSVIEPNIGVLKFCLYPILIAEEAFRRTPEAISFMHVTNSDRFVHDDAIFSGLMRHLDIVNAQKVSFIGRIDTPSFLASHTDIVISHQWGLPLNYLYLECCWQGYPFLHNAEMIKDLGYYYEGNDVPAAADLLQKIMAEHDANWETYLQDQRSRIGRYLASNRELAAKYDQLLLDLVNS